MEYCTTPQVNDRGKQESSVVHCQSVHKAINSKLVVKSAQIDRPLQERSSPIFLGSNRQGIINVKLQNENSLEKFQQMIMLLSV